MNLIELNRALRQLRLEGWRRCWRPFASGPGGVHGSLDLISCWLPMNSPVAPTACWSAGANRPSSATAQDLDNFDFNFNKKMNRSLVFELATGTFIARHEDALF